LRPLKFARHLPDHGWAPVVLCDLKPGDAVDPDLMAAVPETTVVVRDYGPLARLSERFFLRRKLRVPWREAEGKPTRGSQSDSPEKKRRRIHFPALPTLPPDYTPLGWHRLDMPHAIRAARGLLQRIRCEAIMVNVDPYEDLIVGGRMAREFGLPLILDFRDPWSVCALRRQLRPAFQRRFVDRIERDSVASAFRVILNTETALAAYRRHYSDLPPERFTCIRNHSDLPLISAGSFARRPEFTVLFLGRFRRFVEGGQLLRMLAELQSRGYGAADVRLVVSGAVPAGSWLMAKKLGVAHMLDNHAHVPYGQVGPFMEAADLLVSLSNETDQRIPAKFFDYAMSSRPMLVITANSELEELALRLGGVTVCPLPDIGALADTVEREMRLGRGRTVRRVDCGLDSATASAQLAEILDAAAEAGIQGRPF